MKVRRGGRLLSSLLNEKPIEAVADFTRRQEPPVTRCCAKCRRGVPGFGDLPCGYPQGCPNPTCSHAKTKKTGGTR